MKLYDISQEIFSSRVYPGDPSPERRRLSEMAEGALYNLTAFSMCAHNGTHIDAPRHFLAHGAGVDEIPLCKTVGCAFVATVSGELCAADAELILRAARSSADANARRILLRGNGIVTESAARVFAEAGVFLVGTESQSVGPMEAPMAVHKILLEKEVVLLEGLSLEGVTDGAYFLCAQPLCLSGSDGAPCRAILIDFEGERLFDTEGSI